MPGARGCGSFPRSRIFSWLTVSLATFPAQVYSRFRCRGIRHAVDFVLHTLSEKYHERRLGIRTAGFLGLDRLARPSPGEPGGAYEPISYASLYRALAILDIDPSRGGFVDIGCGKGRALVVAATHPFKCVRGVEISPELAECARSNLRAADRRLRCRDIRVDLGDAREYHIPAEVCVALLYFSFSPETLARIIANLEDCLRTAPRPFTVLYKFPQWAADPFAAHPGARLRSEIASFSDQGELVRIYAFAPAPDARAAGS